MVLNLVLAPEYAASVLAGVTKNRIRNMLPLVRSVRFGDGWQNK